MLRAASVPARGSGGRLVEAVQTAVELRGIDGVHALLMTPACATIRDAAHSLILVKEADTRVESARAHFTAGWSGPARSCTPMTTAM